MYKSIQQKIRTRVLLFSPKGVTPKHSNYAIMGMRQRKMCKLWNQMRFQARIQSLLQIKTKKRTWVSLLLNQCRQKVQKFQHRHGLYRESAGWQLLRSFYFIWGRRSPGGGNKAIQAIGIIINISPATTADFPAKTPTSSVQFIQLKRRRKLRSDVQITGLKTAIDFLSSLMITSWSHVFNMKQYARQDSWIALLDSFNSRSLHH